jgi:NADPH-dependent ferric siderophore reductase
MTDLVMTAPTQLAPDCALLQQPFDWVCDPVEKIVLEMGYEVRRADATMEVRIPLGQVVFTAQDAQTLVTFSSPTPPQLQMLKDLYARRFQALGLDAGIRWGAHDAGNRPLDHVHCLGDCVPRISPGFSRVRLRGDFSMFARPDAGLHFRVLIGPEGAELPSLDENGLTYWPGGQEAWHRPVYTVRALSPDADWLDLDVARHDGGRMTAWCDQVVPGQPVALSGPSGSKLPQAETLVLLGDETALPVIMNIIDNMPVATDIQAVLALRDPRDVQGHARADVQIALCDMADPNALLKHLSEHLEADQVAHLFFAAEKAQAVQARDLIKAAGWRAQRAKAVAYWTK